MPVTLKFPEDIDVEGRNFLDITAFKYSLPTIFDRDSLGVPSSQPSNSSSEPRDSLAAAAVAAQLESSGASESHSSAIFGEELYKILTTIPPGFGDSISAVWENESISMLGNASQVTIGMSDIKDALSGQLSAERVKQMGKDLLKGGGGAGLAAAASNIGVNFIRKIVEGSPTLTQLRQTGEAFTGTRIQVNKSRIYKGSSGIELNLSLQMAPKNQNEGENMIGIVEKFRAATIPNLAEASIGNLQFYTYPPIFRILIRKGGQGNSQPVRSGTYFEYRAMALTSFAVQFSSGGQVFSHFHDDIPTRADLTLAFASLYPVFNTNQSMVDKTKQRFNDLTRDRDNESSSPPLTDTEGSF